MRERMIRRGLGILSRSLAGAAMTLRQLLKSDKPAVRLGAARAMFELHVRVREATEFEARIVELERRAAVAKPEGYKR
jgi:hypothetical protein